jgi:hypothetical protein
MLDHVCVLDTKGRGKTPGRLFYLARFYPIDHVIFRYGDRHETH